jgi:hypothetical protein
MQHGASEQDRRSGFQRGGWATGAGDDETRTLITRTYQRDRYAFSRFDLSIRYDTLAMVETRRLS